jgi:DNA-directed RNA polymerase subunit H
MYIGLLGKVSQFREWIHAGRIWGLRDLSVGYRMNLQLQAYVQFGFGPRTRVGIVQLSSSVQAQPLETQPQIKATSSLSFFTKKRTAFCLEQRISMDEDKALETLRIMLGRRGLDTKTERVVADGFENANFYTVGNQLVVFSRKSKGMVERDVNKFVDFADGNDYSHGIIVVALVPPSENVLKIIKQMTKTRLIQFFHMRQLLFDITTHRAAMPHRILKEDEKTEVFKTYNINTPDQQLPWIDSQDPMVKWIGGRPGDVIEVNRHSDVAGAQLYYRYCVPDVNIA